MSGSELQPQPQPVPPPPCYRHPDRAASVLCAHCDKPICTDCMIQAQVGWQCPECTSEGAKRSRHVPAFTHTSRGRTGVVGSTNPTPVVIAIIAINVVVFFFEGFGTNTSVVDRFAMWPDGVHFYHQYYRAFTALWLHADFVHIFFNMIALLIVGPAVEVLLGKARFLALYLIAGLGGSVASYLLSQPNAAGIGASGAIMGVMVAYAIYWPHERFLIWGVIPVQVWILVAIYVVMDVSGAVGVGGGALCVGAKAECAGFGFGA